MRRGEVMWTSRLVLFGLSALKYRGPHLFGNLRKDYRNIYMIQLKIFTFTRYV